jgi:hypothetical protein
MPERAGQPGLADPAGAGDQDRAVPVDPLGAPEALEQRPVEAARGAVVHVFHAGVAVAQVGGAQPGLEAAGAAPGLFAVEHQPDPGDGIEAAAAAVGDQLGEGLGHAVELERAQRLVGGVGQQGSSPLVSGRTRGRGCWRG